jgi:hypothetical protein
MPGELPGLPECSGSVFLPPEIRQMWYHHVPAPMMVYQQLPEIHEHGVRGGNCFLHTVQSLCTAEVSP